MGLFWWRREEDDADGGALSGGVRVEDTRDSGVHDLVQFVHRHWPGLLSGLKLGTRRSGSDGEVVARTRRKRSIEGTWYPEDGQSRVRIVKKCGPQGEEVLTGFIAWISHEQMDANGDSPRDKRNPDPNLRSRKILGMPILLNFVKNKSKIRSRNGAGDGICKGDACKLWDNGQIYDPNTGWKVDGSLMMNDAGDELEVKGWLGVGPLKITKRFKWARGDNAVLTSHPI